MVPREGHLPAPKAEPPGERQRDTQFDGRGGPVRRLHRERQPGAGPQHLPLPEHRPGPGRGLRVRQREHLRPDHRQRPREGRLPDPADLPPGQQVDHGAADHDRRLQASQRRPDHRRRAVLRLRPLGQEGPAARPHHRSPDRRHDDRGRGEPPAHRGPPSGPDPGLLQHPGGRADGRPPALRPLPPEAAREPGGGHGPGLCQAGPHLRRAAGRAAGHRREAPHRQPGPGRGPQRHRRRPRQAGHHRRRRDRHGRHADPDRRRPRSARA